MALTRDVLKFSKLSNILDFSNISKSGSLNNAFVSISVRTRKHYDPRFKWLRSKKVIPVVLPHTEEYKKQSKKFFQNLGIYPRYWKTRPLTVTSASEIIDPYVPEVGDGKTSKLSKGIKDLTTASKSKITDVTAMRKIKNYDTNFKKDIFVQEAQDIYISAHTVLMQKDQDELSKYVTEKAITQMMDGIKNQTVKWKFIESLEPPVIVRARVQEVLSAANLFAQLTVRFHTKQSLAIYDRFGRLIYGSEILAKDVLEYVVFEKHINNEYGVWKLHAKIIPEWSEPTTPYSRTYRIEDVVEDDDDDIFIDEEDPEPDPNIEHKAASEVVQAEAKPLR